LLLLFLTLFTDADAAAAADATDERLRSEDATGVGPPLILPRARGPRQDELQYRA